MRELKLPVGCRLDKARRRHAAAFGHRRNFSTGPEPIQNVFPFFTGLPRRAARVI